MQHRPMRSALYIPGSNQRALEKARSLPVDAIIFDLEDAVVPDAKDTARATLVEALKGDSYGLRLRLVRINGLSTPWGADDAAALRDVKCDGIVLPKVNHPADLEKAASLLPNRPLWAMMETPIAVLNAAMICAQPQLRGIIMGTNDLAKDLQAGHRAALTMALQTCVLAARAAGIVALDGVYNAFKDDDGLRAECTDGRDLGFDGKTLIHPAQIAITNAIFGPSCADIAEARAQIAAFAEAEASGSGVAVVDGRIVENLHIAAARATLAKAEAIAALESA